VKAYFVVITVLFQVAAAVCGMSPAQGATVIIHDDVSQAVIKPVDDCLEVIYGIDGIKEGSWDEPTVGDYHNVWLRPSGSVEVTSTVASDAIFVQYHASDANDGVTYIYVDSATPIIKIDTYMRSHWYVEIRDLPYTTHTVKVYAPDIGTLFDIVYSPHRSVPGYGDNDVWYFCFAMSEYYDATIEGHCETEGQAVNVAIALDGVPTGETTPHTFVDLTESHTITVADFDLSGHPFKQWLTGQQTTTIEIDAEGTYTAAYQAKYNLIISGTAGGTTNPIPDTYAYWDGTPVSVTAQPDPDWSFDHWVLDGFDDYTNPIDITMDDDHTLNAVFRIGYDVTIRALCRAEAALINLPIMMDGSPTGYSTPHSFNDLAGSHTFTVPDSDEFDHPFAQWGTGETNPTISIDEGGTYIAFYGPENKIPALTEFGTLVLLLLLVGTAAIIIRRRRHRALV